MIEFIIPAAAVGKGRPRVTSRGTYTPQKTKDYEAFAQACFRRSRCRPYAVSAQPLKAEIVACFAVPKSYAKKRRAALLGKPPRQRHPGRAQRPCLPRRRADRGTGG